MDSRGRSEEDEVRDEEGKTVSTPTKGLERKCHAQVESFVKVLAIDMCVDRTVWRLYKVPCHERFSRDAIVLMQWKSDGCGTAER